MDRGARGVRASRLRRGVDPERWHGAKRAAVFTVIVLTVACAAWGISMGAPVWPAVGVAGGIIGVCVLYLVLQRRIERYDRVVSGHVTTLTRTANTMMTSP